MNILKKIPALIFLSVMVSNCSKNHLAQEASYSTSVLSAPRATISSAPTVYHGLYVDGYNKMVGDTAKEDSLLRWCKKYGFNVISLYGLNQTLGKTLRKAETADFIHRAKTQYGIIQVTAIGGDSSNFQTKINSFNNGQSDTVARFNYANLELEWWNNAATFPVYVAQMKAIQKWGSLQNPKVPNEEYIGWFQNPTGEDSIMAAALVQNSVRILVHDYQKTVAFSYVQSRLDYIGRAAKAQGKIMPVIIIFSAEKSFSYTYFTTHNFSDAYQVILNGFTAASFPGKSNVRLIGYQVFDQGWARKCKP